MPDLSETEMAALRFMAEKPLRIDPFSRVPNLDEIATMLDELARIGVCQRTLEGINRVYSITPEGEKVLAQSTGQRSR